MSDQSDVGGVAVNGGGNTTRRSPLRIMVWLLVVLLLAYLASPYVSFWRFTKVMRAKDRTQMERYVDFRAVRESLKEQLRAKIPKSEPPADSITTIFSPRPTIQALKWYRDLMDKADFVKNVI